MRLSNRQIAIIRELLGRHFGPDTRIWLFGSRLNDALKGGDIDIYVEPGRLAEENYFLLRQKIERELSQRLHSAVDLLLNSGHTTAFMRMVKREGIPL